MKDELLWGLLYCKFVLQVHAAHLIQSGIIRLLDLIVFASKIHCFLLVPFHIPDCVYLDKTESSVELIVDRSVGTVVHD